MAWGNGGLFTQTWKNSLTQTAGGIFNLSTDVFKVALYNNTPNGSGTPPAMFVVTAANAVYAVDQWVTGNEQTSGAAWPAAGVTPGSPALSESPSGTLMWTLANISQTGTTLSNVYGCLVYDSTLTTKYAVCGVPFGSAYNTVAGTFGITWPAAGIFNIDLTP